MKQPISKLKEWFGPFKMPTANQFGDWIDSYFHKDSKIPAANVEGWSDDSAVILEPGIMELPDLGDEYDNKNKSVRVLGGANGKVYTYKGTQLPIEGNHEAILFWNGTTKVWGIQDSAPMLEPEGVDVLDPDGEQLPKEKAVAIYVGLEVNASKQDIIDSIFNNSLNIETVPELTAKKYISAIGAASDTTSAAWNATVQFESLRGATVLGYKGDFGINSTRLAFYSAPNQASLVGVYPGADVEIIEQDFDVPAGAKYYRASVRNPVENGFKITLKNVPIIKSTPLISFEFVGNSFVYVNDVIQQANIVWNDGSTGRVVYGDWDDVQYCYKSFVATSVENNLQVTQPAVTFNSSGQITNYPKFIITSI